MGNKISNGSSPRSGTASAMLIRVDGDLQEFFNHPIKISTLLTPNSDTFICNSDQMDFNQFVTAMKGEEELRVGQLYFELPANWLTRRIQAEDMVSLAVKASAALEKNDDKVMRCGCYHGGGRKRVDPLEFSNEDYDVRFRPDRLGGDIVAGGIGNRKTKISVAKLTVILEE